MQALSPDDGSADAVRAAADAAIANGDQRASLERELDRLNLAVQGTAAAIGQQLSWMVLTQGFALAAYMLLLIGGWTLPLPGKRWLLLGIAGFSTLAVVCTYLGLRAARDRVGPLKAHRQRVEDALERIAARPPVFARQGPITAMLAHASTRGLPLLLCAGWVVLSVYTLGLPLPTETTRPVAAAPTDRSTAAPAASVAATKARPSAAPTKGAATSEAPTTTPPNTTTSTSTTEPVIATAEESPLLNFLRRAINTPPPAEAQEPVKP
jgi:hypothetical protein